MRYVQQSEYGKEVPCFEVEATAMESTFDRLYSYLFGLPADAGAEHDFNRALPTAIFILNLDKVCLLTRNAFYEVKHGCFNLFLAVG